MIAGALVSGCGSSDDDVAPTPTLKVQAYDGAIWGIIGSYQCGESKAVTVGDTDFDGFIAITDSAFVNNPENCTVTFAPDANDANYTALDTSNNKNMSNVTYVIPKGMLEANKPATASPFSTLVAKQLDGAEYSVEAAQAALKSLGLEDITNTGGVDITMLMQNTSAAMETLKKSPELYSKTMATTVALSDIQALYPNETADKIAAVTKNQAAVIINQYPTYPKASADSQKDIFVVVTDKTLPQETFDDYASGDLTQEEINQQKPLPPTDSLPPVRPTDPDTKPTGGTGGGDGGTGI